MVPPYAKQAGFAKNAGAVNGIKASKRPLSGALVPLGKDGKFPSSVGLAGPIGPAGPKGDAGSQGPKGDTGAAGAAGAAGATNVVQRFGNSNSVAANANGVSIANCHAGERAVGGGFFSGGPTVTASRPSPLADGAAATGWEAGLNNTSVSSESILAYVMCASP